MPAKIWDQIVQVHNEAKTLFILAEELERKKFRSFLAPVLEQRHALEHIVRAKANECGDAPDEEYQRKNLNKALGHEYRAFFDCADWLALILREDILDTLSAHEAGHIQTAIPEYYSDLRPRLEVISRKVAQARADKDVSDKAILEGVSKYKEVLSELTGIRDQIMAAVPSLVDLHLDARRKIRRERTWQIVSALLLAAVLGLCGFLWSLWRG